MNIKTFSQVMAKEVTNMLGEGHSVDCKDVLKNNGVIYHALVIKKEGRNIAPTIYIDQMFEDYNKGSAVMTLASEVVRIYNSSAPEGELDIDFFGDFSQVSDKLFFKVVNYERNHKKLKNVPIKKIMDLAMVPLCKVRSKNFGEGTITIENAHLKDWEISEDELWENIKENANIVEPAKVESLLDVVGNIVGDTDECNDSCGIFVVSNKDRTLGASAVFYPGVLKGLSEAFNSDLFVIPSSIHEMLVIPDPKLDINPANLKEIINEVNTTTVAEEEILSNNLYMYDREEDYVYTVAAG